jgi:acyl-CoA thioester hydrolase
MQAGQTPGGTRRELSRYPWVHEIRARFADVDNLGHINNVAVVSFYEDARSAFNNDVLGLFSTRGSVKDGPFHFLVARTQVDYLAEAHYPGNFQVGVAIGSIGRSSVVYHAGLFHDAVCVGLSETVLVHRVDGVTTPVPAERRVLLEKYALRGE